MPYIPHHSNSFCPTHAFCPPGFYQVLAIEMIVEEYLRMDEKLYAAFMGLVKAYDCVNREAVWNVLKIYGVGGQLVEGISHFVRRKLHVCKWMMSLEIVLL